MYFMADSVNDLKSVPVKMGAECFVIREACELVKQNRGISDFKVQTDTSAEARDRKELPAKIWIKPINCLEYIDITFVVTPEGASFEE